MEEYPTILKLSCRPFTFTACKKIFCKKMRFATSLPASFSLCMIFEKRNCHKYNNNCNSLLTRLCSHNF